MKVMHVHERLEKVVATPEPFTEEAMTCQKHNEFSMPAFVFSNLVVAHGEHFIDKVVPKLTAHSNFIIKEMEQFHSSNVIGAKSRPRHDIAYFAGPDLANASHESGKAMLHYVSEACRITWRHRTFHGDRHACVPQYLRQLWTSIATNGRRCVCM